MKNELNIIRIDGLSDYGEVWKLQERYHAEVLQGAIDVLILTKHEPVITIGRGGGEDHFLAARDEIAKNSVKIVYTNRGGDITYHGPGQLVLYPILNLKRHYQDVHRYLRDLEEVGIRFLGNYGVQGARVEGRTGVWTRRGKIAAIGVHVKKWVTMHGMAFNVCGELKGFEYIVPCGIADAGVSSLERELGEEVAIDGILDDMVEAFVEVFGF